MSSKKNVNKKPGSHGNHRDCVVRSGDEVRRALVWAVKETEMPENCMWESQDVTALYSYISFSHSTHHYENGDYRDIDITQYVPGGVLRMQDARLPVIAEGGADQ
ncbi:hypothetical protein RJ40_01515 [Methanofollis aquaemaris]|uniref:Uncharacterized protein n=1 Tax=Methanofollis aquaemaris TaxID=126734 RepID=A0A8A3S1T1_9EURY|nr:hypothetical protein [Methanofollis aquaemaris]QSZ66268.1 hypothetical protein RJ40_01515 [Methanofollis aquaemaris]